MASLIKQLLKSGQPHMDRKTFETVIFRLRDEDRAIELTALCAGLFKHILRSRNETLPSGYQIIAQVERLVPDRFADALVLCLKDLEFELVRDVAQSGKWKHFVLIVATTIKIWKAKGDVSCLRSLTDYVGIVVRRWIAYQDGDADSATSSRELLYSACTRYLLKAISSVLVAEDPILLDVLSQRMRLKIMSNELSETAKANYLEAFLDLNTQKTIASSGAGIRSQGEDARTAFVEIPVERQGEPYSDVDYCIDLPAIGQCIRDNASFPQSAPRYHETITRNTATERVPVKGGQFEKDVQTYEHPDVVGMLHFLSRRASPVQVFANKPLKIGRAKRKCDLVLEDPHISRLHATIEICENGAKLRVPHTKHDVLVNGQRIVRQDPGRNVAVICDGDVIQIRKDKLRYEHLQKRI